MVSTWVSFHFIVVVQNHVYTITSYSRRSILNGQLVELNAKNDTSRPLTSGRLSSFFVSTLPLTEQAYSKMKKNNNKGTCKFRSTRQFVTVHQMLYTIWCKKVYEQQYLCLPKVEFYTKNETKRLLFNGLLDQILVLNSILDVGLKCLCQTVT